MNAPTPISIRLFAEARDRIGSETISVVLDRSATIADLRRKLAETHPALESLLEHAVFAVEQSYVADDAVLDETAEVALIPPVSGG